MKRLIALVILCCLLVPTQLGFADTSFTQATPLKGVWVATVLNIDYPSKATTSSETLKAEAIKVLDEMKALGFNAVFLQVRPTADAFYPSEIFPWSKYLSGQQGLAPDQQFDPLKFWVDEAHKRGMGLHAWLNPYRITKKTTSEPAHAFNLLTKDHPAVLHPEWVVKHTDGNLYFDPGLPQVRALIVSSVEEIMKNYPVDGIHFDDYFYPDTAFDDQKTFATYGGGKALADWRRDNVNQLINDVHKVVEQYNPKAQFGISPFGIWANAASVKGGSQTSGLQSYSAHYADSKAWVKEGMIDYIAPQIYWNIGKTVADYDVLARWWQDLVKGTSVKLYIGHAAYKAGATDPTDPWFGDLELVRQLNLNQTLGLTDGSIFFSYRSFKNRPSLYETLKQYYAGTLQVNSTKLSINGPPSDITTSYTQYYVSGQSDPLYPLTVNGEVVTDRTTQGYFGVLLTIEKGVNTFVFKNGDQTVTRKISRGTGSSTWTPTTMDDAYIIKTSTYPQQEEAWQSGSTITLSAQAPIGATMTVTLAGQTISMVPNTATTTGKGYYPTTFKAQVTLPTVASSSDIQRVGRPVYTMNHMGKTNQVTAPNSITVLGENAPLYARVVEDLSDTYHVDNSSKGSAHMLRLGMVDRVTALTGDYARLGSGKWIKRKNVAVYYDLANKKATLNAPVYTVGSLEDTLSLPLDWPASATADYKDGQVTLNIANTLSNATWTIPSGGLVQSIDQSAVGNRLLLTLKLAPKSPFNGYYVEKIGNALVLHLKRMPATPQATPLAGVHILIDAGHGGDDPGALGLKGATESEKFINLQASLALKKALEKKGALVTMTRTTDVTLSLYDRLRTSLRVNPDLFISMHANSIGPDRDITDISGFSVHYYDQVAKTAATRVNQQVISDLSRKERGVKVDNFYVVRGTWAPSILLETGFVPNPYEYEWLTAPLAQQALAESITRGLEAYFRRDQ